MAKMKCTHFIHLLKGLPNKNIGRVSILTFEQFTKRAVHYLGLGCSVAYSIYSIGGCYTCYIV